jgi:hypothetical protein
MEVPVIILNWNRWNDTIRCLCSIRATGAATKVWLADNGSDDDHCEACYGIFPKLKIIRFEENLGWAAAYNRALKLAVQAGCEMAYLLNNDTIVDLNFLASACRAMINDAQLAAVGSSIVSLDRAWIKFNGKYLAHGKHPFSRVLLPSVNSVEVVNGAGMLVRLKAMAGDAWFDERFFCYAEETEWCWRIKKAGWHIAMAHGSVIYHRGAASNINHNAFYYRERNKFLLLKTHSDKTPWSCKEELAELISRKVKRLKKCGKTQLYYAALQALQDGMEDRFGRRRVICKSDIGYTK